MRDDEERREHRREASDEERDLPVDEPLHDDLTRQRPDARGREPGREERDPEEHACAPAEVDAEGVVHGAEVVPDIREPARVEDRSGGDEHAHVHDAGETHRDHDVDPLEAGDPLLRPLGRAHEAVLGERRVQVDHVRHHRRAEDSDCEEDALRPVEAGHEEAVPDSRRLRMGHEHLEREGDDDDPDQARDHRLEPPEALRLQGEDPERGDAGQERGREEGKPEQELEPDRSAHELREVGRHGDDLRLQPEEDARRARVALTAHLGQVLPGGDAELRAHRLDEHRHQVRHQDDPQQEVAVARPRRHVGGEVARVDVRDRSDERRPEERPSSSEAAPAPRQRLLRGLEDACLAGEDVVERVDESGAVVRGRRPRRRRLHLLPARDVRLISQD